MTLLTLADINVFFRFDCLICGRDIYRNSKSFILMYIYITFYYIPITQNTVVWGVQKWSKLVCCLEDTYNTLSAVTVLSCDCI